MSVTILTLLATTIICCTTAARILGVFPHPGLSHHLVFLPYLKELASRGHRLHVISHFESSHADIVDMLIKGAKFNNNFTAPDTSTFSLKGKWEEVFVLHEFARGTENLFGVREVRELLNNGSVEFDLIITEHFNSELSLGFVAKFNVPFVLLSSCALLPWTESVIGQPHQISYRPSASSGLSQRMSYVERLNNALIAHGWDMVFHAIHRPWSRRVIKENLGLDVNLDLLATNASLVLANTHFSINGPSATVPQLVEVGGIHINPPKDLPQDIQTFIDESEHGVIYFCMGSLLRGETFPAEKRKKFLDVFEKIPQRVLWKWEGEELPGRTSNIMIRKWMPQRDILAHPNVKLFISHGGLLGLMEAVHEGVPTLAMPIFGDQMTNVKAIKHAGAGDILDYSNLKENEIFIKVKDMLTNPIYTQKVKMVSEVFRDRPISPMETAIYWTEYVIRHKGAPHLQSAAVGMPWYQYYMIDIISTLLICIVAIILLLRYFISKILSLLRPSKKLKTN
ncbi:UDP-glycosyltransferase UGT5-like [Adelges cooleyi]|uniref:UDP-glycosyltransferase UGT5-like n=1 Tax=Adelges cooleyi TaxID=133065 RepID=UPI00217F6EE5|nr:UDP-glycosyltransferase UGT5-like [Adelges cooleyi]